VFVNVGSLRGSVEQDEHTIPGVLFVSATGRARLASTNWSWASSWPRQWVSPAAASCLVEPTMSVNTTVVCWNSTRHRAVVVQDRGPRGSPSATLTDRCAESRWCYSTSGAQPPPVVGGGGGAEEGGGTAQSPSSTG
jgi:hypothetical protein